MATTSSIQMASKAIGEQGTSGKGDGGHGRFRLKAIAAGVAMLGFAGALAFGGLRAEPAQTPPMQAAQSASNPYWVYTADVVVNSDPAAAMALVRVNPYWTYQEDVILNGNPAQAARDWEQQERGQVAP